MKEMSPYHLSKEKEIRSKVDRVAAKELPR
jgi:hypothetical protein